MSVKGRVFTGKMESNVDSLRDQYLFATVGKTGSGKVSLDIVGRKFAQVATAKHAEAGSTDHLLVMTGHGCKEGWLLRITSSANGILEEEVLVHSVIDENTLELSAFLSAPIEVGDSFDIYKPVYERVAPDGSSLATVVSPPMQFTKNGATVTVADDANPANVNAIPVLIKATDGTNITINAGDISVQNSAEGANFDSIRIGDGTTKYAAITANLELKTHDEDAKVLLTSINNSLSSSSNSIYENDLPPGAPAHGQAIATLRQDTLAISTSATGDMQLIKSTSKGEIYTKDTDVATAVASTNTKLDTLNSKDFATSAKQDTAQTRLNLLATEAKQDTQITRLNLLSTEAKQDTQITRLNLLSTEAKQDTQITALNAVNTALGTPATASATTDTGTFPIIALIKRALENWTTLQAKIPVIGQKVKTGSIPVVLASDSDALKVNEWNSAGQLSKATISASGTATVSAPAGASGCFIKNQSNSAGELLYWEIGGTATTASNDLVPGQGTAFIPCVGTISLLASSDGSSSYAIQWLIK